jgi:hypothetical protein
MPGKRKALSARRKRMSGAARLQSGRHWLRTFSGKRVVRSYARWFGVDLVCAAKELGILGLRFAPEYLDALRRTTAERRRRRRDAPKEATAVEVEAMCDHEVAYIAAYTEGGVPSGLTWEEMDGLDVGDAPFMEGEFAEDDLQPPPVKGGH